jgi:hypothetical protein
MDKISSQILLLAALVLGIILLQALVIKRVKRKSKYAIEPCGPKRLEIITDVSWRKAKILFDGAIVRTISSKREFLTSQEFQLPDGSFLRIKLTKVMFSYYQIQVWRNGEPLHNFEQFTGPLFKVTKAASAIGGVGLFPILWVIVVVLLGLVSPKLLTISTEEIPYIVSIVMWGVLFLVLAFFSNKHSLIALFLATAIYLLDAILGTLLYGSIALGLINSRGALEFIVLVLYLPWGIGFLVFHIIFLVPMIQGCFALMSVKRKEDSTGLQIIIPILLLISLAAGLYWALVTPQVLSNLNSFYSQIISPLAKISPVSPEPTQSPIENPQKDESICWTNKVNLIEGNRFQVWENVINEEIRTLLPFDQFKTDVVQHNPQLIVDGYIFYREKFYLLPEMCH